MFYEFWFENLRGIGSVKRNKILEYETDIKEIYNMSKEKLKIIKGISDKDINTITSTEERQRIKAKFCEMKEKDIRFVSRYHNEFPEKLLNIQDSPFGIYVKGKLPRNDMPCIAMIGARKCSGYGRQVAKTFAQAFAESGIQIISGLASGIDSISQEYAVKSNGDVFAVLGNGVDVCYPRENYSLYKEIEKKGGIISEYSAGTVPQKIFFPKRNRIISAFADIILVIEAKQKSGTLITVEYALDQGKEVYVVPGRVDDVLSQGCNDLIKQGAGVATGPGDILEIIEGKYTKNSKKNIKKPLNINLVLEKVQLIVYSCLSLEPKNIQEIISELSLSVSEIVNAIIHLQMLGLIEETSKNCYARISIE